MTERTKTRHLAGLLYRYFPHSLDATNDTDGAPTMVDRDDIDAIHVKYDPETDAYRALCPADEPYELTYTIVVLVAEATGNRPESLEPLFDVIDPDALEKLFESNGGDPVRVEFRYGGCSVTAYSHGEVRVAVREDP